MAISQDHLVVVNAPDMIEEHNLMDLQSKSVFRSRVYPLYNYTIPEQFDLDFSDAGGLIYITAKDKTTNSSVLLVYRAGMPTVASLYDVFYVNGKYEDMLVDATGTFADYILFSTENQLNLFRQYEIPFLVFQDTFNDFSFNLTYSNTKSKTYLSNSTVFNSNYPVDVTIKNPKLNDKDYLNSLIDYKDDSKSYVINDHGWFDGSVVNYTITCEDECGADGKIKLVNHVQDARDILAFHGMSDYAWTLEGGVVQQTQAMMTIKHNGSIAEFIGIPTVYFGENCQTVAVDLFLNAYVSGCLSDKEVYLYLTSKSSHKAFSMGPQRSAAQYVTRLVMFQNLLFLTDVDEFPQFLQR